MYGMFDSLFLAGKFEEADKLLATAPLQSFDSKLVFGLLALTLQAKDKLPSRPEFVTKARKRLQELVPDRVDALMKGLE